MAAVVIHLVEFCLMGWGWGRYRFIFKINVNVINTHGLGGVVLCSNTIAFTVET